MFRPNMGIIRCFENCCWKLLHFRQSIQLQSIPSFMRPCVAVRLWHVMEIVLVFPMWTILVCPMMWLDVYFFNAGLFLLHVVFSSYECLWISLFLYRVDGVHVLPSISEFQMSIMCHGVCHSYVVICPCWFYVCGWLLNGSLQTPSDSSFINHLTAWPY